MNSVGKDTEVVSLDGDIVTFEVHCQRLANYIEWLKEKALLFTQRNPELTAYIQSLQLFRWPELYLEDTTCFYFVSVGSPSFLVQEAALNEGNIGRWATRTGFDENGRPKLCNDFSYTLDSLRERLVADFIIPKLANNMEFFVSFIKEAIYTNLQWDYINEERRGECYELLFQHNEPDKFWLMVSNKVRVLIGELRDIEIELASSKERYMNNSLLIVDMDRQPRKADGVYSELLKGISNKRTYVWSYGNFVFLFDLKFRTLVEIIDKILKIGMDNTYKLGELLSTTLDDQGELIRDLRKTPTGDGKAYEELVKKILEFLFNDEFNPFRMKDQVGTHNKKRIRDFVIDNRSPRSEFWRDLKSVRNAEKILFDAKNYKDPVEYSEITSTLRYLKNKAFGNFIIIISRRGVKDYEETIEDYSEDGRVILYLCDEDLIAMIFLKKEGKSPTSLIEEKYFDFLDKK